jgi:hypothetical protein
VAQVVKHLPSKHKAPSSNPNITQKQKKWGFVEAVADFHVKVFLPRLTLGYQLEVDEPESLREICVVLQSQ